MSVDARAVIVAEDVRPLEERALGNHGDKTLAGNEIIVHAVLLAGAGAS